MYGAFTHDEAIKALEDEGIDRVSIIMAMNNIIAYGPDNRADTGWKDTELKGLGIHARRIHNGFIPEQPRETRVVPEPKMPKKTANAPTETAPVAKNTPDNADENIPEQIAVAADHHTTGDTMTVGTAPSVQQNEAVETKQETTTEGATAPKRPARTTTKPADDDLTTRIRNWATANDIPVAPRGRIAKKTIAAYHNRYNPSWGG